MSLKDEALMYLDMGWCVYPAHHVNVETGLCSCGKLDCPCPGKHPVGRWSDFRHRLPTKKEVEIWFGTLQCNIGMVTGQISGGIVVVDVDGPVGKKSAEDLDLEATLTSRTGGGGYHFFYKSDVLIPSRVGILKGIDIRGEGGYIVLPPSIHHSGRHYEWSQVKDLAEFNSKPFDDCNNTSLGHKRNGRGWSEELLQGVSQGKRNISATRLAGRYFSLGLSASEVWILISAWNWHNSPPLDEHELRRTVSAVRRKHEKENVPVRIDTLGQIRDLLSKGEVK